MQQGTSRVTSWPRQAALRRASLRKAVRGGPDIQATKHYKAQHLS